ncbi:hypothetical protein QYE76_025744 [Lolium multiflorum]|uniref:Uncharacterized protein n=1 Tax=Lolium multiflorum TaxID=4521 RepID=A0AAD8RG03_LOLMU|nr:hypothetical protein QYE76_025744 [Lolium multiflorum]
MREMEKQLMRPQLGPALSPPHGQYRMSSRRAFASASGERRRPCVDVGEARMGHNGPGAGLSQRGPGAGAWWRGELVRSGGGGPVRVVVVAAGRELGRYYRPGNVYVTVVPAVRHGPVQVRNPSEIFSELDEIKTQGPILPRSFRRPKRSRSGATRWRHHGGAALPGRANLWCGLVRLLTCPSAYLKPRRTPVRTTIRKTFQRRSRRQSHLGDSGDRLGTLPERDSSPGGLYTAMVASGVMSE